MRFASTLLKYQSTDNELIINFSVPIPITLPKLALSTQIALNLSIEGSGDVTMKKDEAAVCILHSARKKQLMNPVFCNVFSRRNDLLQK
jgi:hypothetical protein